MTSFLDVYTVPDIGNNIHSFLTFTDESNLDKVNKEVYTFNREYVYPMCKTVDLDTFHSQPNFLNYLKKITYYIEHLTCKHNSSRTGIPTIRYMPSLKEITYAVPLVIDSTQRRIHPATHRLWGLVNNFLQSLYTHKNFVKKVNIVPGCVILVRCDPITDEFLEEHIINDTTEGSHLELYRWYGMPVVLNVVRPTVLYFGTELESVHCPFLLASYNMEKIHCTDWNKQETGIASVILDLIH